MKYLNSLIVCLFALVLSGVPVSAFVYDITYYDNSATGNTINTDPISFYSPDADAVDIYQSLLFTFNVSTPPNSYSGAYLSPFGVTFGVASGSLNVNRSCLNIGTATKSYSENHAEGRNTMTHDGNDISYISTGNRYVITTDERYFTITNELLDGEDYIPNLYFRNTCYNDGSAITSQNITVNFNPGNYGECFQLVTARTLLTYASCETNVPKYYGYTVFNSTAGNITFSSHTPDNNGQTRHILYPLDDPSTIIESCINTISCIKNVNLEPNTLYVVGVGAGVIYAGDDETPWINITIDLGLPDYDCPSFGECIDGFYSRECIDLNGFHPNLIETVPCAIVILENATLGFEEFVRISDMYKCSPVWFFGTSYTLNTTFRDTPLNWTIGENAFAKRDFLKMTSEWATEGSRSLKMWYIPPKMAEVIINTTGYPISCGNVTGGTLPYVYRNISNTSFSVNFNVTFPGDNMLLSFDVKGCEQQAQQHSSFSPLSWGNVSIIQYWPESCYADSCDTVPKSNYIFNILDTTIGASIIGTPKIASASIIRPDQISLDLTNLGIVPGVEYTLIFAVYPENLDDRTGNCVYFDNIRYERISESFIDILGGLCQSRCIGNDFYEATQSSSGTCSVRKITLGCAGTDIVEALDRGESICDGDVLIRLNPVTKLPERIDCEYGCEDARCLTEEEAVIDVTVASLYAPHPVIQDILNALGITLEEFGVIWFFLSLFMMINGVAVGLGLGIALLVKGDSKEAKDFYIPFIVVVLIILVSATFSGYYPLEIGIPIIVFIGLLLWKTSERIVSGGGGGG